MPPPPTWATHLLQDVCDHYSVEAIELRWRRSTTNEFSSGHYHCDKQSIDAGRTWFLANERIVVTAGSNRRDQKLVLLHELAHYLVSQDLENHQHDETFWIQAWALFRRFGVPIGYARWRSRHYRVTSEVGYHATRPLTGRRRGLV